MIRFLLVAGLLSGTAFYVGFHPPENLALGQGVLTNCPTRFGDWNGTDLSFEDAVVEELQADDLLVRRYQRGEDRVWLCVIVHQHRRYGAHDPRLCYESQGYILERAGTARVDDGRPGGLTVNRFVADRSRDRRVVYYWWTTDGLATADVGAFRRKMALSGALDNRSWGAFVRVEALARGPGDAAAEAMAADFSARVARELPRLFAHSDTGARGSAGSASVATDTPGGSVR
jgi:EpsI family protein